MKRVLLFLIVPALVAAFGLTSDTTHSAPPPNYLALGDSLGVGVGASDPATTGYVPRFRDFLQTEKGLDTDVVLNNLSISGATSGSLISDQLPAALRDLKKLNGDKKPDNDVEVITVDIGGNDVFALVGSPANPGPCFGGPTPTCFAAVNSTFATFFGNFDSILDELRTAAGPDTTIIVMTYYNPLPGCFLFAFAPLADTVLAGLNGLIVTIAATHGAEVADTFGKLPPDDLVGGFDCLHPTDGGYATIAGEFKAAFKDQ